MFLDDLAVNLKPAKEMGITTILVKNPFSALRTLKDVTGVDVSTVLSMLGYCTGININVYRRCDV